MSPAPELSLALCTYAAAAPAAGLAAMPGPCTASLSQQLATGSCELLDKAGFSLRRDTSFLDMDELCTCHGACDKALFLIPEDNVTASTSQQPVSEVASSLPAGLHAHVVASCCEPDEDAPSGCCFEKALQYLAMVDAPEEQYQQQQQPSRTFCPSPRSHHCLAGAQSPACSDSDDDMPSMRRSSQCMVTASTTATATSPFEAAMLAATEAASAAASRPERVAVLAPIAAAPCQPSASAAASAACAPASMPAVVHLARSSGPSATRNANITLAMQFPQVITTEVLAVPAASGTAATTATAANNNGMAAAAVAPASPSPAASGVNGAVSAAAMAAEVSAVQQSVSCEAAVAAAPVPRAFHHKTGGPCDHCGATESPQWRRGPASKPTLCNACGTRYRRTNQLGPPSNSQAARAERAAQQAAAAAAAAANGAAAGAPGCAAGAAAAGTQQVRRNAKRDASAAVAAAVSGLLPAAKRQRAVAPIDMEL